MGHRTGVSGLICFPAAAGLFGEGVPLITLYNASKYKLNSSSDAIGAAASQNQACRDVPNIAFFIGQPGL